LLKHASQNAQCAFHALNFSRKMHDSHAKIGRGSYFNAHKIARYETAWLHGFGLFFYLY
jgi:hypothetical protein